MPLRLHQIDLNLLVALDVLLDERHITRAARRLGRTQSGMSQALRRLRGALDDPLLVRSAGRMVPTPRARALAGPLRGALRALDRSLAGEPFRPEAAQRTFRVAMPDMYADGVLPRLAAEVATAGAGLGLEVLPLEHDRVFEQLRAGEAELAIVGPWPVPGDIAAEPFIEERKVGLVRRGHPLLDGPITVERYIAWPHVHFRVAGSDRHPIDAALDALGLRRRVACAQPYFQAAAALVVESDLVVNVASSVARTAERRWPVSAFEVPLPLESHVIQLAWPRFLDADPGHGWLRDRLRGIAAE